MEAANTQTRSPRSLQGTQALLSLPRSQGHEEELARGLSGIQKQPLVPSHLSSLEEHTRPQQVIPWRVGVQVGPASLWESLGHSLSGNTLK